jgi:outer membrane lipoprotein-sorting protein
MLFITLVSMLYSIAFGQSFEGNITMKLTNEDGAQTLQYKIKGDKFRLDTEHEGMQTSFVLDSPAKKMYVLMTAMQMYMEMNLEEAKPTPGEQDKKPVVNRTGKSETILGYKCEQILVLQGGAETELWATKGLGKFFQFSLEGEGTGSAWERELSSEDMFPLRIIEKDAKGKQVSKMEVTAVEKKSLSDALFKVPSNFSKMDIPMMGRPDH